MRVSVTAIVCASAVLLAGSSLAGERRSEGLWKSFVPSDTTGEFGNEDPMGLAAGSHIKTDCSINWMGEDGKRYCFASGTSLVYFLRMPKTNLEKARAFWMKDRLKASDATTRETR